MRGCDHKIPKEMWLGPSKLSNEAGSRTSQSTILYYYICLLFVMTHDIKTGYVTGLVLSSSSKGNHQHSYKNDG